MIYIAMIYFIDLFIVTTKTQGLLELINNL